MKGKVETISDWKALAWQALCAAMGQIGRHQYHDPIGAWHSVEANWGREDVPVDADPKTKKVEFRVTAVSRRTTLEIKVVVKLEYGMVGGMGRMLWNRARATVHYPRIGSPWYSVVVRQSSPQFQAHVEAA